MLTITRNSLLRQYPSFHPAIAVDPPHTHESDLPEILPPICCLLGYLTTVDFLAFPVAQPHRQPPTDYPVRLRRRPPYTSSSRAISALCRLCSGPRHRRRFQNASSQHKRLRRPANRRPGPATGPAPARSRPARTPTAPAPARGRRRLRAVRRGERGRRRRGPRDGQAASLAAGPSLC
jgi:hypothetical protein